ncbi:ATP-binding response regulator [Coleofasciculus sp. G2-EDA-02]|uniref:ATP-binding response regulator n=1 Tax=Coleofasciculus sp. G2-EDA-02 TaxID=3069529 RepID=UPI0032F12B49
MSDKLTSILIVDDNIDNLRSLAAILRLEGYKVRKAISGQVALETVRSHPPDLILLDIKMPQMDGYTVCSTLKQDAATCSIPVIFLSALNEITDKLKAFAVGGVDYITKPFQAPEVVARVENQLRLQRLSQQLVEQNTQLLKEIQIRQQTEAALHQAIEQTEAANRAKTVFLANMSHELRSPLTGILGYAQLLQKATDCTPLQQKGLGVIYQCGSHLLTLINDILDLSKIEAQKLELFPDYIDFCLFLTNLAELFQFKAQEKKIKFTYLPFNSLPPEIYIDEKRLRQVLINLLSNAINFTHQGTVTLKVSVMSYSCELKRTLPTKTDKAPITCAKIRFEIEDTGIGINPEQWVKIFLPFEQLMESSHSPEGTGLGLTISQKIIALMGSEIFLESIPNVGSKFWFDLDVPTNLSWSYFTGIDANQNPTISQEVGNNSNQIITSFFTESDIIVPPLEELLPLYEAAQIGDVEGVQQVIERLQQLNSDYFAFVTQVLKLADNFDYEEIIQLIDNYYVEQMSILRL